MYKILNEPAKDEIKIVAQMHPQIATMLMAQMQDESIKLIKAIRSMDASLPSFPTEYAQIQAQIQTLLDISTYLNDLISQPKENN